MNESEPMSEQTYRMKPVIPVDTATVVSDSEPSPMETFSDLLASMTRYKIGDRPPNIGTYELVELLGFGSFGEVWKARNWLVPENPPVALKFCLDHQAIDYLRREARLIGYVMRQLQTTGESGIVRLLNAYHLDETSTHAPCLEYEYIAGGDLRTLCDEWQPLIPIERYLRATRVIAELARIVGRMHRLNPPIVHRDLKPSNILVQRQGESFQLKITDFGIGSPAAQHHLNQPSRTMGTTTRGHLHSECVIGAHSDMYASPQQKGNGEPDPRDDVHALGVIWFQMLVGRFAHGIPLDFADILHELDVPAEAIRLIGSCVSSRIEKRPDDGHVLFEKLRPLIRESEASRPPSPPPIIVGAKRRPGEIRRIRIGDNLSINLAWIPPGRFMMGDKPSHRVVLTRGFWMATYPTTQAIWRSVIGSNPSYFKGNDHPMETISWDDCRVFCEELSRRTGHSIRLPTEAEWEYACRAGTGTTYHNGNDESALRKVAWYSGNSGAKTQAVGSLPSNAWGLFDMLGNVAEWCDDYYGAYPVHEVTDPTGPPNGTTRVMRGGAWYGSADDCRCACRDWSSPSDRNDGVGFRIVIDANE